MGFICRINKDMFSNLQKKNRKQNNLCTLHLTSSVSVYNLIRKGKIKHSKTIKHFKRHSSIGQILRIILSQSSVNNVPSSKTYPQFIQHLGVAHQVNFNTYENDL